MGRLFFISTVIGCAALMLPVAAYFLTGSGLMIFITSGAAIVAWGALFSHAWQLYERSSLWLLISLVLVLFWPAMYGFLIISCTFTTSCT
jgi:hypothetical protein